MKLSNYCSLRGLFQIEHIRAIDVGKRIVLNYSYLKFKLLTDVL